LTLRIDLDFRSLARKAADLLTGFNIAHLLLIVLALHFIIISIPSDGFIFDEAHYVPASLKTLNLQPANAEHTPLTKIVLGLSIATFGDYWLAWRLPVVLASVASLYVFYLIANRFLSKKYSLIATAFLSFDVVFFVNGSIAILDFPAILFGLLGIHLYLSKKYGLAALGFAVSFLMKELGLMFLGAILLYHVLTHTALKSHLTKLNIRKVASFFLILIVVGGGGLWLYDAVYKPSISTVVTQYVNENVVVDGNGTVITTITSTTNSTIENYITNPVQHMLFSLGYFSGLAPNINTTESNFRPPWSWILPIGDIFNSPHYFTIAVTTGTVTKTTVDYVSQITPTVAFMLLPILAVAIWNLLRRKESKFALFFISWIAATYLPWLLFGIFLQRMTFNYYFIYTIPSLALGIPYFWNNLPFTPTIKKIAILTQLTITVVFFFAFFPIPLFR
jgi:4-amino-4-deoxy-L-arabinose transferase-like glycosyltransferase